MSDDLQNALPEDSITHDGLTYPIKPPGYGVVREYTKYLQDDAIKGVINSREAYGKEYDNALRLVQREIAARVYNWAGRVWNESLNDAEHQRKLCFLVMKQSTPAMTWEKFKGIWETDAKYIDPDTHEEKDGINGDVIMLKLMVFLQRKNLRRPDLVPGDV